MSVSWCTPWPRLLRLVPVHPPDFSSYPPSPSPFASPRSRSVSNIEMDLALVLMSLSQTHPPEPVSRAKGLPAHPDRPTPSEPEGVSGLSSPLLPVCEQSQPQSLDSASPGCESDCMEVDRPPTIGLAARCLPIHTRLVPPPLLCACGSAPSTPGGALAANARFCPLLVSPHLARRAARPSRSIDAHPPDHPRLFLCCSESALAAVCSRPKPSLSPRPRDVPDAAPSPAPPKPLLNRRIWNPPSPTPSQDSDNDGEDDDGGDDGDIGGDDSEVLKSSLEASTVVVVAKKTRSMLGNIERAVPKVYMGQGTPGQRLASGCLGEPCKTSASWTKRTGGGVCGGRGDPCFRYTTPSRGLRGCSRCVRSRCCAVPGADARRPRTGNSRGVAPRHVRCAAADQRACALVPVAGAGAAALRWSLVHLQITRQKLLDQINTTIRGIRKLKRKATSRVSPSSRSGKRESLEALLRRRDSIKFLL
ncbi:uncharacterized protein BJ171DRAFT_474969 [Polychytrium aggregatum]|uniref:uncharacterized protein n=1 Tax=Polychytrium aggregatum TaxID=110093 RepID=UPI0022FE1B78|nr:uncharacterized protein BJ171DRAFT_474969 [Polychytrium aggregatum]KAI9204336.1 hypothetical protein BJ171DRAFT_474969 [Polychytrium aggregatum]